MSLDLALLSFDGVNSAAEAFGTARARSGAGASWAKEVGFVEHHENGHLVLRGTFARHYVDDDEALHVSERGAAEGWLIGAAIGVLLGPPGFAVGGVLGGTLGSQVKSGSEVDPEPQVLVDQLRRAVPAPGSAIVSIADAAEVDALLAAIDDAGAHVARRTLTEDETAALQASLTASPAASAGPSPRGEEAVEASGGGSV